MTEILDALKSIVEGLEMQTKSDQIKWLTEQQMAATYKEHSWRANKDEKLEINLFYTLDKQTTIEYHCYLRHNHQVYNSYLCINNANLQDGRIVTNSNGTPELQPLEDLLYDKYVLPILKTHKKGYQDDVRILSGIVNKCGKEAARDYKINTVLNDKGGFFGKLFK